MPIYEYKCPSCGDVFEQRRPMSQAAAAAPCPSCNAESPRTISRLARVSHGGEGDGGGEGFDGGDFGGGDLGGGEFGGGHSHDHGHSH